VSLGKGLSTLLSNLVPVGTNVVTSKRPEHSPYDTASRQSSAKLLWAPRMSCSSFTEATDVACRQRNGLILGTTWRHCHNSHCRGQLSFSDYCSLPAILLVTVYTGCHKVSLPKRWLYPLAFCVLFATVGYTVVIVAYVATNCRIPTATFNWWLALNDVMFISRYSDFRTSCRCQTEGKERTATCKAVRL